jgi:hypothetical protein
MGEVMKKYARLLVAITFLFGLGVAAKAETPPEIVVTLPFGFVVGGKTLPAGTYTVSRWSGDKFGSLMLTSHGNRASVFLLPSRIERASADKPQVSFQRVGEQYFLSTIQTTWDVYHIPVSHSAIMADAVRSGNNASASGSSGGN